MLYPVRPSRVRAVGCRRAQPSSRPTDEADSTPAAAPCTCVLQPMDMPDTEYPSTREASIARRYNAMVGDMKFTPFWIDAPARASTGEHRLLARHEDILVTLTVTAELGRRVRCNRH